MDLSDLARRPTEWLRGTGQLSDVVISSRVRLARNLAGMPFLGKCNGEQQAEIEHRLRECIMRAGIADETHYVNIAECEDIDRSLLVERHLISRQHARADHPRGVAFSPAETLAIMVNEEDHLRLQVLRSGLELDQAVEETIQADNRLEESLSFAFHRKYGYLTACPTNVGTGLRISVMLHLPALKMTNEIEKVFRAAHDMRLAIRGLYGEGTEATGDFFQISNQTTLGKAEDQIIREFCVDTLPHIIEYERRAREVLLSKRAIAIDDRVQRSMAVLRAAKLISSDETMYLLSLIRMGITLGRCSELDLATVNELFLMTQPAHLQKMLGRELEPLERAEARATYIRQRIDAASE
ncbi:MAG: protein arginine kinase [Phycisphaerae bacterium]|nr:protein arginine kinase [Phycisphaerae bacterium]